MKALKAKSKDSTNETYLFSFCPFNTLLFWFELKKSFHLIAELKVKIMRFEEISHILGKEAAAAEEVEEKTICWNSPISLNQEHWQKKEAWPRGDGKNVIGSWEY